MYFRVSRLEWNKLLFRCVNRQGTIIDVGHFKSLSLRGSGWVIISLVFGSACGQQTDRHFHNSLCCRPTQLTDRSLTLSFSVFLSVHSLHGILYSLSVHSSFLDFPFSSLLCLSLIFYNEF